LPQVNLASIVDGGADDAVAIVSRGTPITYAELRQTVDGLRGGLVGLGLRPGDRIALLCANNRWFVEAYLAALGAGLVVMPLNPASPSVELERELATVGARAAVVGPKGAPAFRGLDRSKVPDLEHVIAPEGVDAGTSTSYEELTGHAPAPVVDREPEDIAVLIFTAGTAGSPKAAKLTHGSLSANIRQVQAIPQRAMHADDVSLGVLPMFHIFGLNVVLGVTLAAGGCVVLVERFDPETALTTISSHGCTVVAGAPPMWDSWANLRGSSPDAFATVRLAVSGASRLPDEVADAMEERFGVHVLEGYGLTEASPIVTSSVQDAPVRGTIGSPIPGLAIRLVDPTGDDVPLGDPGEIWVQGPNVFAGYWGDDDATARAITPDGWLRTGDIAVADDQNRLRIVDRAKDLIIVSGFNVYPAEVEEALLDHPGIDAAAVVGVEHPHSGEAVKAFVVAAPGHTLEEDEVIDFAATRLARYKCPSKVLFVPEIPQGMAGKVLRRQLRDAG
jgi:long-chain acyl-CoA synthetase